MSQLVDLLPKARDEAYKYTSFAMLARRSFGVPPATTLAAADLPETMGICLCFVDGRFVADLSSLDALPPGVTVTTGVPAIEGEPPLALMQMNALLAQDGLDITVAADTEVASLVELLFVTTAHEAPVAMQDRVRISVGHHAEVAFFERHFSLGEATDFQNLLVQATVADGARLRLLTLQQAGRQAALASAWQVRVARDARFDSHAVHLGGQLVRADLQVRLEGRGAHAGLYGLHLPGLRQHIDSHTRIDHLVPDTTSDEHYRSVVDKGGRSVFNGKVVVAEGADRTDAQQYNANLLLAEQAEADTKPELEIYADEVKCSHGATVGKLDETQLFYLRSRGIGEDAARSVLVWAFADSVLTGIADEVQRATVESLVIERLPDAGMLHEFHGKPL